jgi:hypothetical protein
MKPPEFKSIVRCFYCICVFTADNHLTVDHIIPTSKGGSNKSYNKLNCCGKCNNYKGSLLPSEFHLKVRQDHTINHLMKQTMVSQIQKTIDWINNPYYPSSLIPHTKPD